MSWVILPGSLSYFWKLQSVFGNPGVPFRGPCGLSDFIFLGVILNWCSRPGLQTQWDTLAHFLEKGAKTVTNGSPARASNEIFFNTFLIFVMLCRCCCGSLVEIGFWVCFLQCRLGVRKAQYGFELSFYGAKRAPHICEQNAICWSSSSIRSVLEAAGKLLGVLGNPRFHQILITILAPFRDSLVTRENQPAVLNGLSRGGLNLRSMD